MSSRLQAHWGFTRMPFGRSLAPSMLHRHDGHAEAVARIGWCVEQHALGVITGEVGAGKTVAVRAATAALDGSRHVVIYLPNPSVGVRGMLHHVVSALGQTPSFYTATLVPQAAAALAAEHAERGRTPVVVFDEAHLLDNAQLEAIRMLTNHERRDALTAQRDALTRDNQLRRRVRDFASRVLAVIDTLDFDQKQTLAPPRRRRGPRHRLARPDPATDTPRRHPRRPAPTAEPRPGSRPARPGVNRRPSAFTW